MSNTSKRSKYKTIDELRSKSALSLDDGEILYIIVGQEKVEITSSFDYDPVPEVQEELKSAVAKLLSIRVDDILFNNFHPIIDVDNNSRGQSGQSGQSSELKELLDALDIPMYSPNGTWLGNGDLDWDEMGYDTEEEGDEAFDAFDRRSAITNKYTIYIHKEAVTLSDDRHEYDTAEELFGTYDLDEFVEFFIKHNGERFSSGSEARKVAFG